MRPASVRGVALPRPVQVFLLLTLVFTALSAFRFLHLYATQPEHLRYPGWGYFFYWPIGRDPHFPDITCFARRFHFLHTPAFFSSDPRLIGDEPPFEYPGAASFLYLLPYSIPGSTSGTPNYLIAYLTFIVITVAGLAYLLGRVLTRAGLRTRTAAGTLLIAALLSYPFWFEFGTANVEFFIFLFLLGGTVAFCKGRFDLAAVLYGAAGGMKIFPLIFIALFLARKQYRQIAIALATALALNLAGLRLINPSISYASKGISAGLAVNRQFYMLHVLRLETSFDHSLFGLLKRFAAVANRWIIPEKVLSAYLLFVAVSGLALYFVRIRKMPFLNQVIALYIIAILFPPTSHDYTLIHLYVPWGLLFLYMVKRSSAGLALPKGILAAFVCLAIACSTENELTSRTMGYSAQLKCVALVVLLGIVLKQRWPWPEMEARTDPGRTPSDIPPQSVRLPETAEV